jgi:hypothetical protein
MTLILAMVLGTDCIDDCDMLRSGRVSALRGQSRPSRLGTFLGAFTFGNVRQLDRLLAETLTRAWQARAGPGPRRLVVDVDSFIGELYGRAKQGSRSATPPPARLSPDRRDARRHAGGAAHPAAHGLGEHLAGGSGVSSTN